MDRAWDIDVNQQGIFILAEIDNEFNVHRTPGTLWTTHNLKPNLGVIWIEISTDLILDIEAYDIETLE